MNNNNNQLVPLADIERMGMAIAKSGLFGVRTPEQAIALMLIAQAEGLPPAIAARDYHVIEGRPTLKADAMLARFQQAGGRVAWGSYTNDTVSAEFSHPQGGVVTITWTMAMAKAAGLAGRKIWAQYPRQMLRARVISEGIRTVFPGVLVGSYTPEEVEDMREDKPVAPAPAPRRKAPAVIEAESVPALPAPEPEPEAEPQLRAFVLEDAIAAINGAQTMDELKAIYTDAYNAADALGDDASIAELVRVKDARKVALAPKGSSRLKKALPKPAPAPEPEPEPEPELENTDDIPFGDEEAPL